MTIIIPPRFETSSAVNNLDRLLHLNGGEGEIPQDWELLIGDPKRLAEFCDLYETGSLDTETKFALMMLTIAFLDDALRGGELSENDTITAARIELLLRQDFILHLHTIHYWALLNEADIDKRVVV